MLETDGNGTVTGVNVFADDGLVARKQSGSWRYYQFDPQGSVAHRTTSTESVLNSSKYDAYGEHVNIPTGGGNDPFGWNGRWGYYGDTETGLALCMHRYYDADAGRWLTRDPIGYAGGVNLYGYCGGKPIGRLDPEGKAFYEWLVTGDGNASNEVYEAGLVGWWEGLETGIGGLQDSFTLGLIKPSKEIQEREGYEESVWLAGIGRDCLIAAAGLGAVQKGTGQYGTFVRYKNAGGGGFNWRQGPGWGRSKWRADVHPWGKPTQPPYKWPHIDWPGRNHWPW